MKAKVLMVFLAMVLASGIFGIARSADATPSYLKSYNDAHETNETNCQICHTASIPNLNTDGTKFKNSGHNPCSIGDAKGQCVPPVINTFTANPNPIDAGQSSTLAWTLSGATPTALTIDKSVGNVKGLTSKPVTPSATTTYTLTNTNLAGTTTKQVTVTVNTVTPASPVIDTFTATSPITAGQSSTLSWKLSGGTPTTLSIDNAVGTVLGLTSTKVTPSATTIYTLTASNSVGGPVTKQVTVTVNPVTPTAPVITSFTATSPITAGQSSTLSWKLSGGTPTTLSIDNGMGSVLGLTSTKVTPSATTTYTLTASNSVGGPVTKQVTVTVNPVGSQEDMSIWVGKWFKVSIANEGFIARDGSSTLQKEKPSESPSGYLNIVGWDPDNKILQCELYTQGRNESSEEDEEGGAPWPSQALELHYLAGSELNLLAWYQETGDFTAGLVARIRGVKTKGRLTVATFKTLGGYYIDLTNGYAGGGLSITGHLVSGSKAVKKISGSD